MSTLSLSPEAVRNEVSLRRRFVGSAASWVRTHAVSLALLTPLLAITAVVHLVGSANFPRYIDDPGTYLSQAWSLRYEGKLSPYSYFYDHAPAGWIQIAAWALLTDGFERYDSVMAFGTECMLIARLATTAFIFALVRRLGFTRLTATVATLLYALCPLAVIYGRWTYLDNIAVSWLIAAFYLATSPRRSIAAATGGFVAFAMAALSKETFLVFLPAFLWALIQNLDRRNRSHVFAVSVFAGTLAMAMYPLFALYKGELFPGPGHNSLLETAGWQLSGRASTGTLLDGDSAVRGLLRTWLTDDPYLLWAGLGAMFVAVLRPNVRPLALALATGWAVMLRDGYVPFMHVIALLPLSAILVATAIDVLAARAGRAQRFVTTAVSLCVLAAAAAVWLTPLRNITGQHETPNLRAATIWAANNIPRDKQLVVHDSIWTDLVHHYGFEPRPVIVHKLDTDPAVAEDVDRIDYLIVPDWYYRDKDAVYPTLLEARKHAVQVAAFGEGDDGVRIFRVSRFWNPS